MYEAMKEEWVWIEGYEGHYKVSSLGRVWSVNRKITLKNLRYRQIKARVLPIHVGDVARLVYNGENHNMPFVKLSKDGVQTSHTLRVLVAKAFIPNPENYTRLHMIDNDRFNCRADNLKWISFQEAMQKKGVN